MRTLRLLLALASCLLPCALAAGCGGEDDSLSLTVERADPMPFEGPCPVTIVVTNAGSRDVPVAAVGADEPFCVTLGEPSGWKLKEYAGSTGRIYDAEPEPLAPGESLRRTVYLHNIFTHLKPGRATVALEVTLFREKARLLTEGQEPQRPVELRREFEVNLVEQGAGELARRLAAISARIQSAASAQERLALYESVKNLSHPDLVPVLFRALSDDSVGSFHFAAKVRLVDLCETYGMRQALVDYLATCGERLDQVIFDKWKEAGVRLSEEQLAELRRAKDPWVRLTCLKYYGPSAGENARPNSQAGRTPPEFRVLVLAAVAYGGFLAGVAFTLLALWEIRRRRRKHQRLADSGEHVSLR